MEFGNRILAIKSKAITLWTRPFHDKVKTLLICVLFQILEMYPQSKTSEYVTTAEVPVETLLVDGPGRKVPPAPQDEFEGIDENDETGMLFFLCLLSPISFK